MPSLEIGPLQPPQLTADAEKVILLNALELGLMPLSARGISIIESDHEPFALYLEELGALLNNISAEGSWPKNTLKVGAAIGALAYREAGYYHQIEAEHLRVGLKTAGVIGLPEAYAISYNLDTHLTSLMNTIQATPIFSEELLVAADSGGYKQILDFGAGSFRHFLQETIIADQD